MRAEANFPWISGANYGTAPLFFPRAPVPFKTFQGSRFKGVNMVQGPSIVSLC